MKKRCKFCRTIVKCENVKSHEEDGRGVYCDVCGAFISIPKNINGNVRLSNRGYIGRSYGSKRYKTRKRNQSILAAVMAIIAGLIIICIMAPFFTFFPLDETEEQPDVEGPVIAMNYWNTTIESPPDFNIIEHTTEETYITYHYYNLTIFDFISEDLYFISLERSTINEHNIIIGSIIKIYFNDPFIELEVEN